MQDLNLNKGPAYIDKDLDLIRQQFDILFSTTPQETSGAQRFGADYESCLYDLKYTADQLEDKIRGDINSLDMRGYSYDVSAKLYLGTERDIALVDITVYNDINSFKKTYKIS